jgi:hypothetical protein
MVRLIINCTAICCPGVGFARIPSGASVPLWRKCSAGSLVAKEIYPIVSGFSNSKVESAITHMVRLIINCTAICCPGVGFARMLLKLKMNPIRNPDVEYAFIING